MPMFLLLMALISSSSPAATTQDLMVATQEMQKANYFTFVLLIKMAPFSTFQRNITFLMPNDRALSETNMSESWVDDFLLRHSIPWPLLIDHLEHFPSGSMVPTSKHGLMLKVTNDGRRSFFLGNVRIVSPNICTKGSSIRCHGIDGVVSMVSQPDVPPTANCSSPPVVVSSLPPALPSSDGGSALAPAVIAAQPRSVVDFNAAASSSSRLGYAALLNLVMTFCILAVVELS